MTANAPNEISNLTEEEMVEIRTPETWLYENGNQFRLQKGTDS